MPDGYRYILSKKNRLFCPDTHQYYKPGGFTKKQKRHYMRLKSGMTLAIEPMIAAGDWNVDILADDWTAVTRDRSLSAHYEHTVAVTKRGMEILSLNKKKSELAQIEERKHA